MYYIIHYAITHYKFSKFDKKISGHKACKIFRCQTPEAAGKQKLSMELKIRLTGKEGRQNAVQ